MSRLLHVLYGVIVVAVIISFIAAVTTGYEITQANKLNDFILHVDQYSDSDIPDNEVALFARAYHDAHHDKAQQALDSLTRVVATDDISLRTAALFNRGNINLRQAMALSKEDSKRIPLVELAKQDYRTALLLAPMLWDVRFNLELALRMVPEDPSVDGLFEKPNVLNQRTVKTLGFKVDLP